MAVMKKRLRPFLLFVALGILTSVAAVVPAQAKSRQTVYPVKITINVKEVPTPPGQEAGDFPFIVLYGRITSREHACVRHRLLYVWEFTESAEWFKQTPGILSTATGKWEKKAEPDSYDVLGGGTKVRATLARERIGRGRTCAAATSANPNT